MIKLFIKTVARGHNTNTAQFRSRCGSVSGFIGMLLNLMLFGFKLFAGMASSSAAIIADAFNNLTDIGSSVITFIGFKMAGKPADRDHPYGHGRIEYIAGLFVAIVIIMMGFELAKAAVQKIISPVKVVYSGVTVAILVASIAVKLFMFYLNRGVGNEIKSSALKATAQDSFNDAIATFTVLAGIFISHLFKINIDGILGLLVALFIFITGIKSVTETLKPVLGEGADPELVEMIKQDVLRDDRIIGIHDLCVHNYGPSKILMSLHAEVDSNGNILELHDMIDNIERDLRAKFNCDAVIHMDPIVIDDERTNNMRRIVSGIVKSIDNSLSIHDFRMTDGHTHTNLIFDIVVPFGFKYSDNEIIDTVEKAVSGLDGRYFTCISIDKE